MGSEWRGVSIESIAKRIAMGPFGSDIKTENFVSSGVPVIRGGNLSSGRFRGEDFVFLTEEKANELMNANAYPGDLVFTHRGTLGQVGLLPDKPYARYVVSQSQMKLTCDKEQAIPEYIYYYFKSPIGQNALLMNTSQTGVPAISRPVTSLKAIRLHLPPVSEQRAIAHILGTLDDKIELNRKMNETLETMAQTLFKSWFGEKNENSQKILFGDLVQPKKGKNITKADVKEGKVPVVAGGIEPSFYHNIPNTKSPVITVSASGANAGFVNLYHVPVWSSDSSFIDNSITTYIYFSYVFLKLNQETLFEKQEGSAQPHIYPRHVMNLEMPLISEKLLGKYENIVSLWFEKIKENIHQIETIKSLRDSLLPKLISGQLRIKDAEKIIGNKT